MAQTTKTVTTCDVFGGTRTKRYKVSIEETTLEGLNGPTLFNEHRDLSKAALDRLFGFVKRGLRPPGKAEDAPAEATSAKPVLLPPEQQGVPDSTDA